LAVVGAPLVIDGSYGEGGASLIRTALALATLTQQPTRIINIRLDERRTGLTTEDVAILRGFALSCGAEVIGGEVGEKSMSFIPTRRPRGLNEKFDVPEDEDGPGHTNALVLLGALLPLMGRTGVFSSLTAKGETYGQNVLSFDYFANVTLPALRRFGLYAYADLNSAGFGRGSRGEVSLEVEPSALTGVAWPDRGKLIGIRAIVATAELPETVGQRGVAHLARLGYYANVAVDAEAVAVRGKSSSAGSEGRRRWERAGFGWNPLPSRRLRAFSSGTRRTQPWTPS